jgi:hypothetical protein
MMLGDGSVTHVNSNGGNTAMQFTFQQSNVHTKYFKFVLNVFCNVVTHVGFNYPRQRIHDQLFYHQLRFPVVRDERIRWYRSLDKNSLKRVPPDIEISPVALAFWICDDGADKLHGGTSLCTNGFLEEDAELLRIKLKDIELHNTTIQKGKLFQ